jgi:hypothetical protein
MDSGFHRHIELLKKTDLYLLRTEQETRLLCWTVVCERSHTKTASTLPSHTKYLFTKYLFSHLSVAQEP